MSEWILMGHYFRLNDEIIECIDDAIGRRYATFRNIYNYDITSIRKEFVCEDYEYLDRTLTPHNMMRG